MKKANVIIANRGRDEHLNICLKHLNLANVQDKYDVTVYVVYDDVHTIEQLVNNKYSHINVIRLFKPVLSDEFNKAALLNYGLKVMRQNFSREDFSFVSIVDADMIYSELFFDTIASKAIEKEYIVCHGRNHDYSVNRGPSQITLTSKLYYLFLEIYGENLYDEAFIGYGAEDSELSFKANDMRDVGLLRKISLPNMWVHMYHEKRTINEKNIELFNIKRELNKEILRRWLYVNSNTNV